MPTILRANMNGSSATQYHPVPLAGFYLGISHQNAEISQSESDPNYQLRAIVVACTFAAMALEAFANELAEDLVPDEELEDFIYLRKKYKKKGKGSALVFKLDKVLSLEGEHSMPESLKSNIEEISNTRNNLVHYKLTESAGKSHLQSQKSQGSWKVSFLKEPEQREEGLVEQLLNGSAAVKQYNAAYDFFLYWYGLKESPDALHEFSRISI